MIVYNSIFLFIFQQIQIPKIHKIMNNYNNNNEMIPDDIFNETLNDYVEHIDLYLLYSDDVEFSVRNAMEDFYNALFDNCMDDLLSQGMYPEDKEYATEEFAAQFNEYKDDASTVLREAFEYELLLDKVCSE